jgi:hypothetical protein
MQPMSDISKAIHPTSQKILVALKAAATIPDFDKHIIINGSLGKLLDGDTSVKQIGDIDVLIDQIVCQNYWRFVEVLTQHGLRSVFDVIDRPSFAWSPCSNDIGHAKLLVVDCASWPSDKHGTLDIVFNADHLSDIKGGKTWVKRIPWQQYDSMRKNQSQLDNEIARLNQELADEVRDGEKLRQPHRKYSDELKLWYASKSAPVMDQSS